MHAAPVLTGRCFWIRRTTSNGPLLYTLVTASKETLPLSLLGNTYYERRFGNKTPPSASTSSHPTLHAGDIVIRMGSTTPGSVRGRRIVDVTGIQTSYFDASEKNDRFRCRVDDVVHSMHLHDGHEMPELRRGVLAVGKLTVLGGFLLHGVVSLLILQNASGALLKRRSLNYYSEEEGLQLVRVIAENCHAGAIHGLQLLPVMRGDSVVGVRL